jgi:maltose-binding protein MalE
MKKWQHKVIGTLLAIVVIFVGVASYTGLNGMGYHKLVDKQESGTVYFWYTNDLLTNYYNNVASVYNHLNRGANVVPKLVSASEYLEKIYQTSIDGENYPDMYVITSDALEKAYLSGLTMPVEVDTEAKAAFPKVAVEAASYDNALLGYPFYFDTSTLVYNKTMLEEVALDQFQIQAAAEGVENPEEIVVPEEDIARLVNIMIPETIDELIELSNNLEAPDGLETVFKWNINDIFFNYFYLGEYATLTDKEIELYNEEIAACMEIFKHVTEYFYMDAETVSTESILQEFMEGKVLFTILDSESALKLETANKEGLVPFEYEYALTPDPGKIPQEDESLMDGATSYKGRPLSVTNVVVVNGYTNYPETTHDFAKFLTVESMGIDQLYEKTGYIPASIYAETSSNMEDIFKAEYDKSATIPPYMVTSNFWMLLENAFNQIWDGAEAQTILEDIENQLKNQIP